MSCLKYHTIIFAFFGVFKHCKKEFSDWDCQKMVLGPWSFKYFVNRWCLEGCYFLNVVLCAGFSVLHFIILFYFPNQSPPTCIKSSRDKWTIYRGLTGDVSYYFPTHTDTAGHSNLLWYVLLGDNHFWNIEDREV